MRRLVIPCVLVSLLIVSGWGAHRSNLWLEGQVYETRIPGDVGPLPDGKALRVLALGFERLVADLFWLRTTNYVGNPEADEAGFPAAARLAQLVTDIDPYFTTAYVVMNSVLTVLTPQHDAAIALLAKGIRHNDDYWKLHFLQGFTLFFDKRDYARAAEHMRAAAERGGPDYLPLLATRLYAQAGSPETAIAFVVARLREERDEEARQQLIRRLLDLQIQRDLLALDAAIDRFRAAHGRSPDALDQLVEAGLLRELPRDPTGGAYFIRDGAAATALEHQQLNVHRAGETR